MQSTFEFGEISLEFINKLRDAQRKLQCERSMNNIEKSLRMQQDKKLEKFYFDFAIVHKKHFVMIYLMLNAIPKKNYNEEILVNIKNAFKYNPITTSIPPIKSVVNFMKNITDLMVIDIVTYSFLPSYFHFYLTDFESDQLFYVLQQIDDDTKFDLFARSVFISPFFLNFIQTALQPVLSQYLHKDVSEIDKDIFINQIFSAWNQNTSLIPNYVVAVLNVSTNPQRTLSRAFFEIALQPQLKSNLNISYSHIYCFFYFSQRPSNEYLAFLRSIFTIECSTNIIDVLISNMILISEPSYQENLFSSVDSYNAPSLFHSYLMSTYDFVVIEAILGATVLNKDPQTNLDFYICFPADEEKKESFHNVSEHTMADTFIKTEVALRHLLQSADTIPHFRKVPENYCVEDFFLDYLVHKGPPETLPNRKMYVNSIQCDCTFSNTGRILYFLSKTGLDRKKEIRALSALNLISQKIKFMVNLLSVAVTNEQKNYYSFFYVNDSQVSIYHSPEQYYEDPNLLSIDFQMNIQQIKINQSFCSDILYAYLTQGFNFAEYKEFNANLFKIDEEIHTRIPNEYYKFCKANFVIKKDPPNFDESRWIFEQLDEIKEARFLFDMLIDAFQESSLLRKLLLFNQAIHNLRIEFQNKFPTESQLGADQYFPIEIAFVLLVNPPGIVANFSYINDFCYDQKIKSTTIINNSTEFVTILKMIIKTIFPDMEISKFCKLTSYC